MSVILEVTSGPLAGHKTVLDDGHTLTVGRSPQANLTIHGDNLVSTLHFALEESAAGCRLIDRGSTNGTFCNRVRVQEKWIVDGDEIRAGHTTFLARRTAALATAEPQVSPAPEQGLLKIGHWSLNEVPKGWDVLEGRGLVMREAVQVPISVAFMEEELPAGRTLRAYVENQIALMKHYLKEPKIEALTAPAPPGPGEGHSLIVYHIADDGRPIAQRQVYVVSQKLVGIATLTALNDDYLSRKSDLDHLLHSVNFNVSA